MAVNAKQLSEFLGRVVKRAEANPRHAPVILERAALQLIGAAAKPENAPVRDLLNEAASQMSPVVRSVLQTDFEQLLRDTHAAYQQTGGDPMAQAGVFRALQEGGGTEPEEGEYDEDEVLGAGRRPVTSVGPPRLSITPASIDETSTLGRSAVLKYQPTGAEAAQGIVQEQTLILWQGRKQEAQACTIDMGVVQPPVPATTAGCRPYGEVEYGSDGNKTNVRFDVGAGTRFTVAGNYVSVLAGMDPPPPGQESVQLSLGASLGMFAAPSQGLPTRTIYYDQIVTDGADGYLLVRPTKAVAYQIQSSLTAGTMQTSVGDLGTDLASLLFRRWNAITFAALSPPPWITLSNDAFYIWFNPIFGAITTVNVRVVFQLAL